MIPRRGFRRLDRYSQYAIVILVVVLLIIGMYLLNASGRAIAIVAILALFVVYTVLRRKNVGTR